MATEPNSDSSEKMKIIDEMLPVACLRLLTRICTIGVLCDHLGLREASYQVVMDFIQENGIERLTLRHFCEQFIPDLEYSQQKSPFVGEKRKASCTQSHDWILKQTNCSEAMAFRHRTRARDFKEYNWIL